MYYSYVHNIIYQEVTEWLPCISPVIYNHSANGPNGHIFDGFICKIVNTTGAWVVGVAMKWQGFRFKNLYMAKRCHSVFSASHTLSQNKDLNAPQFQSNVESQ